MSIITTSSYVPEIKSTGNVQKLFFWEMKNQSPANNKAKKRALFGSQKR